MFKMYLSNGNKTNKSWRVSLRTLLARARLLVVIYSKHTISCTPSQIFAALFSVSLVLCIIYRTTFHGTSAQKFVTGDAVFNQVELPPIVWKWGLCQLSDIHDSISAMVFFAKYNNNDTPHTIIDITLFENIKDGDLICLPDSQIDYFITHILPNITSHFSLLSHSGTSRAFISRLHGQKSIHKNLIRSKYLLKWFACNYDGNVNKKKYNYNNKLEAIPLGYDFHTPWMTTNAFQYYIKNNVHGPKYLGHYNDPYPNYLAINALLDDRALVEPDLDHRIRNKVFVGRNINAPIAYEYVQELNYSYDIYLDYYKSHKEVFDKQTPWLTFGDRFKRKYPYRTGLAWLLNHSEHDIWYMEEGLYPQYELFERRSKYVFVLSPFGNGWDCFRTWEAIWFGHIVIVQSTAGKGVDDMFINHELPVVIVDNMDAFAEIDEEQLNKWYEEYKPLTYFENANTRYRMTNTYWINYMKDKTISLIP
eukprot:455808_1